MTDQNLSRTEQRKKNDQRKALAKAKEGSILPAGHQRDQRGRTKPA